MSDFILILVYVVMWCLTFTAMNADQQRHFEKYSHMTKYDVRECMFMSGLFATIPVLTWIAVLVVTGGYASGFLWKIDFSKKMYS